MAPVFFHFLTALLSVCIIKVVAKPHLEEEVFFMNPTVSLILGIVAAVALTVFLYVKVMPRKYDGKLPNKFLQCIHNFINFKKG